MTGKALIKLQLLVCATLFVILPSPGFPAASPQFQDPNTWENVVLGENPLIRELGPPAESPTLRALASTAGYRLRVVYMIPGNRAAQPGAEETLQRFVIRMQDWFRDQMERLGYEPKTFVYETEEDGSTPKIDVLYVEEPDSYFHSDYLSIWNLVLNRISSAGFPIWQEGVLSLVIAETHVQELDGHVREGTNFVGGAGTNGSGVAMVTGETLARLSEALLTDDRPYAGLVIPAIGPYPLVQDVSFAWYEGTTLSSTSSSAQGAVIHELGHGLNLWHEFRNDRNFNGNLMGNGLRGWRGSWFPNRYPADDTHLSTASALVLDGNRFFNVGQSFIEAGPGIYFRNEPSVLVNGLCGLRYTAYTLVTDAVLGGALLIRAGQVVADTSLAQSVVTDTLYTYDYTPGVDDDWTLLVTDRLGNRTVSSTVRKQCESGRNRAPQPQIEVTTTRVDAGKEVMLDASRSTDPDGSWLNLMVRWDVDGDGYFDTDPTPVKSHSVVYPEPGIHQVVAQLTDENGDSSLSVPIGLRVERHTVHVRIDVKPDDVQNTINPGSKGVIWVAVLSAVDFDPLRIDVSSVRFGPGQAAAQGHETADFNSDGATDVALRFRTPEVAIRCGDTDVTLAGITIDGQDFASTDSISTVGCRKKAPR